MKNTLGIDVYEYEFPKELGYLLIKKREIEVLLMRHDLSNELKSTLVAEYIGIDKFIIEKTNVASGKKYAKSYQSVVDKIRLPDDYINRMLCSRYATHFYTDEELSEIREGWTRM